MGSLYAIVKEMKALLLLGPSAALVGIACTSATAPAARLAKTVVQTKSVDDLYQANCASCHGKGGAGGGGGTTTFLSAEKFKQKWDEPFFKAIKNGREGTAMEAFGESLSDNQIWALVVHIREMQRDALRAELSPRVVNGVMTRGGISYKMEDVIASGLQTPWSVEWLPTGEMLVTNRPGSISVVKGGQIVGTVEGVPETVEMGQGGFMDLALDPEYKANGWVYLALADPKDGKAFTKIVRGKLKVAGGTWRWTEQQDLWKAPDASYVNSGVHFGCRIVFDKQGYLFFGTGERGNGKLAQDLTVPNGKIHRIHRDGRIPQDNPFASTEGNLKSIWSYGHRNPQGLAFGLDGQLFDTEHGPRGGDEFNKIERGANYGWPLAAYSINYNNTPLTNPWPEGKTFAQPVYRWLPSIGACGLDVVSGKAFSGWHGDFIAGGLSGANVDRLRVKNGVLEVQETILSDQGRVRDVRVGPDGNIYVVLNSPDKVIRLVEVKS